MLKWDLTRPSPFMYDKNTLNSRTNQTGKRGNHFFGANHFFCDVGNHLSRARQLTSSAVDGSKLLCK